MLDKERVYEKHVKYKPKQRQFKSNANKPLKQHYIVRDFGTEGWEREVQIMFGGERADLWECFLGSFLQAVENKHTFLM